MFLHFIMSSCFLQHFPAICCGSSPWPWCFQCIEASLGLVAPAWMLLFQIGFQALTPCLAKRNRLRGLIQYLGCKKFHQKKKIYIYRPKKWRGWFLIDICFGGVGEMKFEGVDLMMIWLWFGWVSSFFKSSFIIFAWKRQWLYCTGGRSFESFHFWINPVFQTLKLRICTNIILEHYKILDHAADGHGNKNPFGLFKGLTERSDTKPGRTHRSSSRPAASKGSLPWDQIFSKTSALDSRLTWNDDVHLKLLLGKGNPEVQNPTIFESQRQYH